MNELLKKAGQVIDLEEKNLIKEHQKVKLLFDIKPNEVYIFSFQPPITPKDMTRINTRLKTEEASQDFFSVDHYSYGAGQGLRLLKNMLFNLNLP